MARQFIARYSEYDKLGYTIEDFYKYCLDNGSIEEDLTKEAFIKKFEDSNEFYEWCNDMWEYTWEDYYNDVSYEADKILGSKDFVKVSGSMGLWNGRKNVDRIIRETSLDEIISKYINVDTLEVEVYIDKVEVSNIHHDGTNYYEFTPFSYGDLKKSELLEMVDKEGYEWYGDKLYKATKQDLINYLQDNLE